MFPLFRATKRGIRRRRKEEEKIIMMTKVVMVNLMRLLSMAYDVRDEDLQNSIYRKLMKPIDKDKDYITGINVKR